MELAKARNAGRYFERERWTKEVREMQALLLPEHREFLSVLVHRMTINDREPLRDALVRAFCKGGRKQSRLESLLHEDTLSEISG